MFLLKIFLKLVGLNFWLILEALNFGTEGVVARHMTNKEEVLYSLLLKIEANGRIHANYS
jgi:hypothetical protein